MASDTDDVERSGDGRMLASGWHGYTCNDCGGYHIDLLDKSGNPFATLALDEDELFNIANKLMDITERMLVRLMEEESEPVGKLH